MANSLFYLMLIAPALFAETDWVEVATPGQAHGGLAGPEEEAGKAPKSQPVIGLTVFDDRIYVSAAVRKKEPPTAAITAFNPKDDSLNKELATESTRFGKPRTIDGKLYIPDAAPGEEIEHGGYYVSAGKGKWERVAVLDKKAVFLDIAHHDGKLFLAGSLEEKGTIAWKQDGEESWHVERLNAQAARWAPNAARFLQVKDHLSVLCVRIPDPNPTARAAPAAWGAWYLLHYCPERSVRGFLFDGKARMLPVLKLIAPDSQLRKLGYWPWHETPFLGGLLFTVLDEGGTILDEKGGLFHATIGEGNPQEGRTFMGRRVPEMNLARAIASEKDTCYVLLAGNAEKRALVRSSTDLRQWATVFDGELSGTPTSLAVLDGTCYMGIDDGTMVRVLR